MPNQTTKKKVFPTCVCLGSFSVPTQSKSFFFSVYFWGFSVCEKTTENDGIFCCIVNWIMDNKQQGDLKIKCFSMYGIFDLHFFCVLCYIFFCFLSVPFETVFPQNYLFHSTMFDYEFLLVFQVSLEALKCSLGHLCCGNSILGFAL